MILFRIVTLYFDSIPEKWLSDQWAFHIGEVEVVSQKIGKAKEVPGKKRLLVYSALRLSSLPTRLENQQIVIPSDPRRTLEAAIETVADLIAISENCHRTIMSAFPSVAFKPEDDNERLWLESSQGMISNRGAVPRAQFNFEINSHTLESLKDRLDGVSLLAEALANTHATGKYRELIRLFERAFLLSSTQVEKKLAQFLAGADLGYSREEVQEWLRHRHGASHADEKVTKDLVLEADIRFLVPRIEQAAYDVLMNKKTWRDPSRERRNVWTPAIATDSSQADIRQIIGRGATISFEIWDDVKAYPLDPTAGLEKLPEKWWSTWAN